MMSESIQNQKPSYRSIASLICSIIRSGNNEKYRKINYIRILKKIPNLNLPTEMNMYYVINEIMTINWQKGMRLNGGTEIIIIN